jgi:uncharacterized membrane protein YraQ (UPF0718 family)
LIVYFRATEAEVMIAALLALGSPISTVMAYVLEVLMLSYVSSELIVHVLGREWFLPVVGEDIIGTPAHLNGYVAPPMLAGLMTQGMGGGLALVFMIAGSISCVLAWLRSGVWSSHRSWQPTSGWA